MMIKQERKLELVEQGEFLGTNCDFYKDEHNQIYMTREQIGEALQYSNKQKAIDNLHARNKDRLDKFSVVLKIQSSDGKFYDTMLYTKDGIIEIIKSSTQPKMFKKAILQCIGCTNNEIKLITNNNINKRYKQHQLYQILHSVYPNISIKTEVKLDNYRVDFVLDNSIIVECDEYGHVDRDEEYEEFREWCLTENMGYEVIRYNPDNFDEFEIFDTLSKINEVLYILNVG